MTDDTGRSSLDLGFRLNAIESLGNMKDQEAASRAIDPLINVLNSLPRINPLGRYLTDRYIV